MRTLSSKTKLSMVFTFLIAFLASGCQSQTGNEETNGTAWGSGAFSSNGQRIYFTATSDRGTSISYTKGPVMGMMMMGGRLACASCHGTDGRGGKHMMHMEIMYAPDIRWSTLTSGHHEEEGHSETGEKEHHDIYDFEDFKNSVEKGKHPDGDNLEDNMPRWKMTDADLRDLMNYLKSLD